MALGSGMIQCLGVWDDPVCGLRGGGYETLELYSDAWSHTIDGPVNLQGCPFLFLKSCEGETWTMKGVLLRCQVGL